MAKKPKERRICEALTDARYACSRVARKEREGRPVCIPHAEAPTVRWQGSPDHIRQRTCATCGGAGTVCFSGWGRNVSSETCPDCLGEGMFDDDPHLREPGPAG